MKATVHWKIGSASGHGQPIDVKDALSWVEEMNRKYGADTHWLIFDQDAVIINPKIVGEA